MPRVLLPETEMTPWFIMAVLPFFSSAICLPITNIRNPLLLSAKFPTPCNINGPYFARHWWHGYAGYCQDNVNASNNGSYLVIWVIVHWLWCYEQSVLHYKRENKKTLIFSFRSRFSFLGFETETSYFCLIMVKSWWSLDIQFSLSRNK